MDHVRDIVMEQNCITACCVSVEYENRVDEFLQFNHQNRKPINRKY